MRVYNDHVSNPLTGRGGLRVIHEENVGDAGLRRKSYIKFLRNFVETGKMNFDGWPKGDSYKRDQCSFGVEPNGLDPAGSCGSCMCCFSPGGYGWCVSGIFLTSLEKGKYDLQAGSVERLTPPTESELYTKACEMLAYLEAHKDDQKS